MGFLFRRTQRVSSLARLHGPARCVAAVPELVRLTHNPERIPAGWETLELLLIQVIPDCPPPTKPDLVRALEDAAAACRNRETARRIMLVCNSLR